MSPDFKDLLSEFNAHGVEYIVVGAFALAAHGRIRATGDLDVWVKPTKANAKRVLRALAAFGAPTSKLREDDLRLPARCSRSALRRCASTSLPGSTQLGSTRHGAAGSQHGSRESKCRSFPRRT